MKKKSAIVSIGDLFVSEAHMNAKTLELRKWVSHLLFHFRKTHEVGLDEEKNSKK